MELDDLVHGRIVIPDHILKIIETPHFQRLKGIKQLGFVYKILPCASYSRYDHSIGTYHLASTMLKKLEDNSDWIAHMRKDEKEYKRYEMFREAVRIAALLHDVGHGPFSHVWETVNSNYHHEQVGKNCIDDIFEILEAECLPEFRENGKYGIELIKALILGDFNYDTLTSHPFPVQYRFLFEIVHNNQCELDVDKLDYLKRDNHFAAMICDGFSDIGNQFDSIFFDARISEDGQHIEYRYEDFKKIYSLFESRASLHEYFYHLPTSVVSEWLLKRILESGDFEIDNVPIKRITSRPIKAFLMFVDEEVLRAIEGHALFPYLNNLNRVKIVKDEQANDIIEEEFSVKRAGIHMPEDTKFHLYGNPDYKDSIVRDTKIIKKLLRFRLLK